MQLYITFEKSGDLHLGLTACMHAGEQAGKQADKIWERFKISKAF